LDKLELRHKLVAILAADAVGYSRLMSVDDTATVTALDKARAVFRESIETNRGRVIDMAGDSVLAVFETATEAVIAALAAQKRLEGLDAGKAEDSRLSFRVGVHLGDVIEKADGTVYGDGVNIAARLEGLSEPGGITVSEAIRSVVKGKVRASFDDQDEKSVKNVADPVRAWRVRGNDSLADSGVAQAALSPSPQPSLHEMALFLPDKPSIAVLPFTNMSGDAAQEYFTDGITEDIITELSRFRSLFVIARNSSFSYKGQSPDVRQVGKDLGVRYVLEGSIRKSDNRIRVTGQLIDALSGKHLWAEKYDRVLADIFDVQEELTRSIVAAIGPHIDDAELEKASRRRPENLSAYERAITARGKAHAAYIHSDAGLGNEAMSEARASLAMDARSVKALQVIAFVHWQRFTLGGISDRPSEWRAGVEAANQAIELDRHDSLSYTLKAMLLGGSARDAGLAAAALQTAQRAHELNPNSSSALNALAYCELGAGLVDLATAHVHEALRVSPRDPMRHNFYQQLTTACLCTGDYINGVEYAHRGLADAPDIPQLHGMLAMNLVGLGEIEKAKDAFNTASRLAPAWVQRGLDGGFAFGEPAHLPRVTTFLRVAGGLESPTAADALR